MSYWCTEFLIVTVDGPGGQTVLPLDQPFARVGRHPDADVCLPHPAVPSRALYLHATRAGVFCLFLDRDDSGPERIGTWLAPEQSIEVGPYRVRASLLTAEPEDAVPGELPSAWGSAKPPLPVMMIYCGNRLKDKRRFRSILSPVGRRPQCALQLKGQKVSGFHCVLFWDQQRLWCIDLNSSNGTQRNGQDIVCEEVVLGDRLEIGEFKLVFQRLSSGGRTGSSEPAELVDEVFTNLSTLHDSEQAPVAVPPLSSAPADWGTQVVPVRSLSRWRTDGNEDSQLELDDRTRSHGGVSSDSSAPSMLDTSAADSSVDTSNHSEAERRRLHDELAAELARSAREREEMQAEWQSATARLQEKSDQLQAKLDAVEEEATRLERQRAELAAAQQAWQTEQAAVAMRLAARGEQLTNLETELAERTTRIEAQLATVQQQAAAAQRIAAERVAVDSWQVERQAILDELASRTGQLHRLESELHRSQEALAAQLEARLQAQLAQAAAPLPALPAAAELPPADSEVAAPSPAENSLPFELPRHEPHVEPSVRPESPVEAAPSLPALAGSAGEQPSAAPASGPFVAEPHASSPEEQAMREFLNTRLVQLDNERIGRRWLWWTMGGAGAALVAGMAFAAYKWMM